MVKNIDMELDQAEAAEAFASEPEKNIWDTPQEDDEDDTPDPDGSSSRPHEAEVVSLDKFRK